MDSLSRDGEVAGRVRIDLRSLIPASRFPNLSSFISAQELDGNGLQEPLGWGLYDSNVLPSTFYDCRNTGKLAPR